MSDPTQKNVGFDKTAVFVVKSPAFRKGCGSISLLTIVNRIVNVW